MRRVALFSDIHGALAALDAVVSDIERAEIAERYCLGDLVGYGPDPTGVIARIRESGIPTVRGNYDQGVGDRSGSCGCYYPTEQSRSEGAASYEFAVGAVGDGDAAWLLGLHDEIRLEESAARILLVHGSPRRINEYLMADRGEQQLLRLARDAGADVVCCGHTHVPYHRSFPDVAKAAPADSPPPIVHYVNSGSVGKPKDGDPRACWVELLLGSADEVHEAVPSDSHAAPVGKGPMWAGVRVHRVSW